ncbi:hypothetical protein HDV01_005357 [Terramyces sp. JEL0728]|nr:hypothetical protein HDV01_005357 [Terramyces sp. JEL0728]
MSESQGSKSEYAQLIYMHSHDPENPTENLCSDPQCPMNNQSELPSIISKIDTKLERYLNSLPKTEGQIHPDMYNMELATEIDVESSVSQQDRRFPLQKRRLQYNEDLEVYRAEMESELRAELEVEIRAEMEAKLRAELKSEYKSQVESNSASNLNNPSQVNSDTTVQSDSTHLAKLQSIQTKFKEMKGELQTEQIKKLELVRQNHQLAVAKLESNWAEPVDLLKLKHEQESEILKLNQRFKVELQQLKTNNLIEIQKQMQLIQHLSKQPPSEENHLANERQLDSISLNNLANKLTQAISPNYRPVASEKLIEKQQNDVHRTANTSKNNTEKKKKFMLADIIYLHSHNQQSPISTICTDPHCPYNDMTEMSTISSLELDENISVNETFDTETAQAKSMLLEKYLLDELNKGRRDFYPMPRELYAIPEESSIELPKRITTSFDVYRTISRLQKACIKK